MINKGDILISEPYLGDANFERSVILICEHTDKGSIGFILNKPTVITFDSVISGTDDFKEILFIGGPVGQDSLHFIFRNDYAIEGAQAIGENLYWGGDYEQLTEMIRQKIVAPYDFRFFLGYSGWGEGQLKQELDMNSWFVSSLSTDEIFDTIPEELWRQVLKNMGGKYKMISNYPIDPRLN